MMPAEKRLTRMELCTRAWLIVFHFSGLSFIFSTEIFCKGWFYLWPLWRKVMSMYVFFNNFCSSGQADEDETGSWIGQNGKFFVVGCVHR